MSTLQALITLKPYGDHLCDPKAKMWLLLMRSSILMIAGCEAAAWGFIGFLMATGMYPWIAAILIGGAVGCLVGGLDMAFVMVDLSKMRSASEQPAPAPLKGAMSFFKVYVTKARLGILVRMVMVAVSLAITAPFLAQLLFSRDIAARQAKANNEIIAKARSGIVDKYQKREEFLRSKLRSLGFIRSQEVAGKGLSGRYGRGPVTESLDKQIDSLSQELATSQQAAKNDLDRFDKADARTRAQEYGVALSADGIVARFEALREMKKIPGFRWTENAFRILLAGFFLGLIIYKWYEPAALQIYFDEELQAAYSDALAGRYEHFPERTAEKVSPVWFSKWYYESAKARERADRLKDRVAAIMSRHKSFEEAVGEITQHPGTDLEELQKLSVLLADELESLRADLQKEREEVFRLDAEIAHCKTQAEEADAVLKTVSRARDRALIMGDRDTWEGKLRDLQGVLRRRNLNVEEVENRHNAKNAEWEQLKKVIAAAGQRMAEIQEGLIQARLDTVRELNAVQREV